MASESPLQPHFVLIPLMCPGHQIPMVDMARLLAQHGAVVTIVTTPLNAVRFNGTIDRDIKSGSPIRVLQLKFPSIEVGLPGGCENIDTLVRDLESSKKFFLAASMLQKPLEQYLAETQPSLSCIISDWHFTWTFELSRRFKIPRLVFDGTSCFFQVCSQKIHVSRIHQTVSDQEPFIVPGLPDRIELTKAQLPAEFNAGSVILKDMHEEMRRADMALNGVVINTFEELESKYVQEYKKDKGEKVWCIGPLSLWTNQTNIDKACRGNNKPAIKERKCLGWLASWAPRSVLYVCLGSLNCLSAFQLLQLGFGLEASNRPFIWVVREANEANEFRKLITEEGFEERTKGRGLLIWGWAPQILILSHPAIGGFLTHCGWNSVLEGICAGVPMITWPLFFEQFFNEKFVVDVLRIGESLGAEAVMKWGEEDKCEAMVTKEKIREVVEVVMDGEERRSRARKLAEMAKKAVEKGGSCHYNVTSLIKGVMQQVMAMQVTTETMSP